MRDKVVHLIPNSSVARLFPGVVQEKELIKGITTDNREVAFVKCSYNTCSLAYKVAVVSNINTNPTDVTFFDRICFEGKAINTFSAPKRTVDIESGYDVSERMKAITPKKWNEINCSENVMVDRMELRISVEFSFRRNTSSTETAIMTSTPHFCVASDKPVSVKQIPKIYLMVYDFFSFLNFSRNIVFDKVRTQRRTPEGKYETIADVYAKINDYEEYEKSEANSIVLNNCQDYWGNLFKAVAERRTLKIYDNFYIPKDQSDRGKVTYEKFLSCALSFESEYERVYPAKNEQNPEFAQVKETFQESAENLDLLFQLARDNKIDADMFKKIYYKQIDTEMEELKRTLSKTKGKKYQKYYDRMVDSLGKIDFSLEEKYKNCLEQNYVYVEPIINRLTAENNIVFPAIPEAGHIFADFRNKIAHGNPSDIEAVHCVLFEVARALLYVMILKKANAGDDSIKKIINKLF